MKPNQSRESAGPVLRFAIREGLNANHFYQSREVQAHTIVRGGSTPRIVIATPSGNSGVGLWFAKGSGDRSLQVVGDIAASSTGELRGVEFVVAGPPELELDRVLIGSVRALRDYEHGALGERRAVIETALGASDGAAGPAAELFRSRLRAWLSPRRSSDDTRPRAWILARTNPAGIEYELAVTPLEGTTARGTGSRLTLSGRDATRFRVRFATGREPLTPLEGVIESQASSTMHRNLRFLSYREAFLAGSWQYLTYFGRDTLITASLLGSRATAPALAAAVGSVLDRIGPQGRVAHEESIGDQAVLERLPDFVRRVGGGEVEVTRAALRALEEPVYDYKMIDGEYLLPQLLDTYAGAVSADALHKVLGAERLAALARLSNRILAQTTPWTKARRTESLVHLNEGHATGNWRDSETGLGGGRTPLDVNAYLVPAALRSLAKLLDGPGFPKAKLLATADELRPDAAKLLRPETLRTRAEAWDAAALEFVVKLSAGQARSRLSAYMSTLPAAERKTLGKARLWSGVSVADALAGKKAPELDGGISFPALALDDQGEPIAIMNSDEAFGLFYGNPGAEQLVSTVTRLFQPYPVGLATPVGLVTSNPGFSDQAKHATMFGRDKYHGAVIWSWPQTMMRQGLERQLARFEGDDAVERVLERAIRTMDAADERVAELSASELWTWDATSGEVRAVAFGQSAEHSDESNAIQLWSNTR